MAKATNPLFSKDARGRIGRAIVYKPGGIVVGYFIPRDPRSAAQMAAREAFALMTKNYLTQAQADELYSAIVHSHLHGSLSGLANDDHTQYLTNTRHDTTTRHGSSVVYHSLIGGLLNDDHPQYFNQARGDARYEQIGAAGWSPAWLDEPFTVTNSTAFASVPEIQQSIMYYQKHVVRGVIFFFSPSACGMRWRFLVGGTSDVANYHIRQTTWKVSDGTITETPIFSIGSLLPTKIVPTGAHYYGMIEFNLYLVQSASQGVVRFQCCQNVAKTTDSVMVYAGSSMEHRQVN